MEEYLVGLVALVEIEGRGAAVETLGLRVGVVYDFVVESGGAGQSETDQQ